MNDSKPDIRSLTIQKELGMLSDDEKLVLQDAIRNPDDRAIYDRVIKEITEQRNVEQSGNWDAENVKREITSRAEERAALLAEEEADHKSKRRFSIYIRSAVAASVILIVGFYILTKEKKNVEVTTASQDVIFTGANGKSISLKADSTEQNITSGNISLTASQNILRYHLNGSANPGQINTLQIPFGKEFTVELSDHSLVHLNAASKLVFPENFDNTAGVKREITIKGEAFITIAQDASRPFLVHLPNGVVQVLGTSFNVNTYTPENSIVSLVSGKVQVGHDKDALILNPGQEAVATRATLSVRQFDPAKVRAWESGKYLFEDAKLLEVSDVLLRYYGVSLDLSNIDTSVYLYTGTLFKSARLSDFLYELTEVLHLHYTLTGDRVILSK